MNYTKVAGGVGGMPSTSSYPNLRKVSEPGMDFSGSSKSTTSSYGSTSTNYSNVKPQLVNQNSSNSNTEIVDMTKSVVSNGPASSSPSNTSVNYSGTPTNQRMGALGTYSATAYGSAPSFAKVSGIQAVAGTNAMEQPNMLDNPNARNITDAATNKGNLYQTTAPGGAVTKIDILGSAGETLDNVIEKVACYSTHPEEDVFRRILRRKGERALVSGDKDTAVKMAAAMNALDLLPVLVEDENDKVAAVDAAAEATKSNNVKSTENDVDKLSADANSFANRFWDWLKENGSVTDTPGEEQKSWWKQPTSYILPGALVAGAAAYGLSGRGGSFRNWVRKIGGLGIQDQAGQVTGRVSKFWNPWKAFSARAREEGVRINKARMAIEEAEYTAKVNARWDAINKIKAKNKNLERDKADQLIKDLVKAYKNNSSAPVPGLPRLSFSKPTNLRIGNLHYPPKTFVKGNVKSVDPVVDIPKWLNPVLNPDLNAARLAEENRDAFITGAKELFSRNAGRWDKRLGMSAGLGTAALASILPSVDDPQTWLGKAYNNVVRHPLSSGLAVGLAAPAIFTNRIGLRQSVTQPGRQALQNLGLGAGGLIGYEKILQPTMVGNMLDEYMGRRNRSVSDRPIRSTAIGGVAGAGLGLGAAYLANKYGDLDYGIDDYAKYTTAGAALGAGAGFAANNLFRNYKKDVDYNFF